MIRAKLKGVALITVMLVVAIAVILATKMNTALIFEIERSNNINSNQQAYWYAMGAEAFAKAILTMSFKEGEDKKVTHLGQIWAAGETSFPVDLGEISGEISDMQACFNLNALANTTAVTKGANSPSNPGSATPATPAAPAAPSSGSNGAKNSKTLGELAKNSFKELIILLDLEGISSFEAESMADSLYDWLDADSAISGSGGAEDNDYAAKEHPYYAANSLMSSVNELRLVEHFSPRVIYALKDFVCVLPNSDVHRININTINAENPELLQALFAGIDRDKADEIINDRGEKGFKDIADFAALSAVKSISDYSVYQQQFVVDSDFFKISTKTSFNDSYFSMNSLLKINTDQTITVVDRSIGAN